MTGQSGNLFTRTRNKCLGHPIRDGGVRTRRQHNSGHKADPKPNEPSLYTGRRCLRLTSTSPAPDPNDVQTLVDVVARVRGRRIEPIAASMPAALAAGMLVSTDDVDYIVYPVDATPLHARRIVMHEVGRLLDHTAGLDKATMPQDQSDLTEQAAVRVLLPDLSPQLIRRILGRTRYSTAEGSEPE